MSTLTRVVLCAVALNPVVAALSGQESATAVLELDHGSGFVRLIQARPGGAVDTTNYGLGRSIQLPRPMNLRFRVVNTNTGLYEISTTATSTASPALAPISAFLGKLGPYLPEIGLAISGAARPLAGGKTQGGKSFTDAELSAAPTAEISRAWELGRKAEQALLAVETRLYGAGGLQEMLTQTLATLEEMRQGTPADAAAARLRQSIGLPAANCAAPATQGLPAVQGLIRSMHELLRSRQELDNGLGALPVDLGELWTPVRDTVAVVRGRVVTALGDFEPIVATAYRVEQLASLAANACASQDAGLLPISRLSGRTVTVSIAPRTQPEVQRVADRAAQVITITVVKKPFVRPSLGVSLINIPQARFNVYGARAAATGAEIYSSAIRDARFSWGASLGTTWRFLDMRETHHVAVWLPELTVSAQPDVKGFGVGGGFSLGPVKLGTGMMWVKRVELNSLRLGQIVPSPQYLKTRDSYGKPLTYWSLAFFGWPGLGGK